MNRYNTADSEGLASARQILKVVPEARRTEPSKHLYEGKEYVPAAQMPNRVPVAFFSYPKGQ